MDVLKEGAFQKITPKPVFVLSPVYAQLPDGLKFVYVRIAFLSEVKYDVIIPAPNPEVKARNLRPLRAELLAVWSDISHSMRGLKSHSFHIPVLGLELSNFSRQLNMKSETDDDRQVIVGASNDLWVRGMDVDEEEKTKRQNAKETKAHLRAMVLRTKPEAIKWLHLTPRIAALGHGRFRAGPTDYHEDPRLLIERIEFSGKR